MKKLYRKSLPNVPSGNIMRLRVEIRSPLASVHATACELSIPFLLIIITPDAQINAYDLLYNFADANSICNYRGRNRKAHVKLFNLIKSELFSAPPTDRDRAKRSHNATKSLFFNQSLEQ